jgi:hypothetical protein
MSAGASATGIAWRLLAWTQLHGGKRFPHDVVQGFFHNGAEELATSHLPGVEMHEGQLRVVVCDPEFKCKSRYLRSVNHRLKQCQSAAASQCTRLQETRPSRLRTWVQVMVVSSRCGRELPGQSEGRMRSREDAWRSNGAGCESRRV